MASRPAPNVEAGAGPATIGPTSVFTLSFGTIVGVVWVFLLSSWIRSAGPVGSAAAILAGGRAMSPTIRSKSVTPP